MEKRREIWLKDSGKGFKTNFRYTVYAVISENGITTEITELFTRKSEAIKFANGIKKDWNCKIK